MKNLVLTLAAALALTTVQASAETMLADIDGNGTYSMEEMTAAYAELTADTFAEIDTDADGEISEDELAAAIEAGVIEG